MRVEVPSGWIELREPESVPERLRRPVVAQSVKAAALASEGDVTPEAVEFYSDLNDHLAIALISAWSFGDAVTFDILLDLPGRTYDAIREQVAPLITRLMPDFSADGATDPKALTEN